MDSVTENYVEKIRQLCKERGIKISKLEKDLGFGNGFLNSKKVSTIKHDRLLKILDYIGISQLEFHKYVYGEEQKNPVTETDDGNDDLFEEMYNNFNQLPDDDKEYIVSLINRLLNKEN